MTGIRVSIVDVYPVRRDPGGLQVLLLRRSKAGRCPGSWEAVHGWIEPDETPAEAALRELREETGLAPARLYNLSRVESFYLHRSDEVALIPVFVALVGGEGRPVLSEEHDYAEWVPVPEAAQRFDWPRERRAMTDIEILLPDGTAGPLEDVLRVC